MTAYLEEYWAAGGFPQHAATGIEDVDALEQGFALPAYLPGQAPAATAPGSSTVPVAQLWVPGQGAATPAQVASATVGKASARPASSIDALAQGAAQAFLGVPASTPAGAIMGAGISPVLGTGPLPGAIGQAVANTFGTSALPALSDVRSGLAMATTPTPGMTEGAWAQLAGQSSQVGRAIVRRVLGVTNPQLREILEHLRTAATQVQATAEHRALMSDADYKRFSTDLLTRIARRTGALNGSANAGPWARF